MKASKFSEAQTAFVCMRRPRPIDFQFQLLGNAA